MNILVFGSINVDYVVKVDRISRPGETNMAADLQIFFGGKGANQAVAAARASTSATVKMAGAIGRDALAEEVLENFATNGIDTDLIAQSKTGTGTAYVFVDPTGENAITVVPGANRDLLAADISDQVLREATHLLFQMEVPVDEVDALAARYKSINQNGVVILNLAPVPAADLKLPLLSLLANTDILVVNEHELLRTSEILGLPKAGDITKAALQFSQAQSVVTVVTLGKKGAIAILDDANTLMVPPTPISPVDTTGAGDTFVGVLASGLAEGNSMKASLHRASLAGARACLKFGAQAAMPFAAELVEKNDDD